MNKKRRKAKPIVGPAERAISDLGLNPLDWKIYVDLGKPKISHPGNLRSSVGVFIRHVPTGRTKEKRERGSFTKRQATDLAYQIIKSELAQMK